MSALTTAAILGLTAASAGTGIAEAAIQSHQAGKAVDAQTAAAQQALQAQQQNFNTIQQLNAPYSQAGTQTLGRLGQMAAQPQASFNPANYNRGVPLPAQQMPQQPQTGAMGAGGMAAMLGGQAAPGQAQGAAFGAGSMAQQLGGQAAPGQAQNQGVTIRTPDGRVLQGFPRERLQEALQRGAQVVNG